MKRILPALLVTAAAGVAIAAAAAPSVLDPMDNVDGFFQLSPAVVVDVEPGGKVLIKKPEPGTDAFVRWGLPNFRPVPIDPDRPRLEVAVPELRGGAALQAKVQLATDADGAEGDLGHFDWMEKRDTPGTLVIEDLRAFAEKHDHPEATRFRLFFRHVGDAGGAIVIDEVRLLPHGADDN